MSQRKLLGSTSIKARVALASAGVLLAGWMVAPRARQSSLTPPQGRPAPLIDEQTTIARDSAQRFDGVQQVRERVRDRLVAIHGTSEVPIQTQPDYQTPAPRAAIVTGVGVIVSASGEILTHEAALAGRTTVSVSADNVSVTARLTAYEPETGLVLLRVDDWTADATPQFAVVPGAPGQLVVALARVSDHDTVAPAFVTDATTSSYRIAPVGGPLRPGTPIYNMRGELLAVAGGGAVALPARAAADRLRARANAGTGLAASLGVVFQPIDAELQRVFSPSGALVSDVISGGSAEAAGIEPGDVLVAVGESLVDSPEAAHRAIVSTPVGTTVAVRVRRNEQTLILDVQPVSAFEMAAQQDEHRGRVAVVRAGELIDQSALRTAAVSSDDLVIRINQRPVATAAEARRELARARPPVLLYLQNDEGQRYFAVLNQAS